MTSGNRAAPPQLRLRRPTALKNRPFDNGYSKRALESSRRRRKTMARPPTGQVLERPGKHRVTYALRFRAYGQRRYVTLDVATHADAERVLAHTLADVERG